MPLRWNQVTLNSTVEFIYSKSYTVSLFIMFLLRPALLSHADTQAVNNK